MDGCGCCSVVQLFVLSSSSACRHSTKGFFLQPLFRHLSLWAYICLRGRGARRKAQRGAFCWAIIYFLFAQSLSRELFILIKPVNLGDPVKAKLDRKMEETFLTTRMCSKVASCKKRYLHRIPRPPLAAQLNIEKQSRRPSFFLRPLPSPRSSARNSTQ